jgi:hypothetical protein
VQFDAAGSKYFAGETRPCLITQNSADWLQQQRRGFVVLIFPFRRTFTASWKQALMCKAVQWLSTVIVVPSELFEFEIFFLK